MPQPSPILIYSAPPPSRQCSHANLPSQEVYHRRTPSESIANTYTPGAADLRLTTLPNSERRRPRGVRGRRRCPAAEIDLECRPPLRLVRAAAEKRSAAQTAKVGNTAEGEEIGTGRDRAKVGSEGRGNGVRVTGCGREERRVGCRGINPESAIRVQTYLRISWFRAIQLCSGMKLVFSRYACI